MSKKKKEVRSKEQESGREDKVREGPASERMRQRTGTVGEAVGRRVPSAVARKIWNRTMR